MSLVIDLRCLQDPNYRLRGIGAQARALARHAPEPFTGLIDPALPPLSPEDAGLAATLSPHAYVPGATCFLNPSPMGPNQTFLARLLTTPRLTKAACVHDFIPLDNQQTYLPDATTRLDYFTALVWLRRYDLFLPNAAPTEARLQTLFGPVPSRVTGIALPPWVHGITRAAPKHFLMLGGDDPRKNPEPLIRAWAAHPRLRAHPLIITGTLASPQALHLPYPLLLPGHVPDLAPLFAQAIALITPSRAEGFSMPVAEAIAARIPALASDIPAHRALLPAAHLFAPDNEATLTALMLQALDDPSSLIAPKTQDFSAPAVAARAFTPLRPKPRRSQRPSLALIAPLPPAQSGIADHSAALLQALGAHAEVTVFAPETLTPLPFLTGKFDATLAIIGNSPAHARTHDFAARCGAAVLCHDSRLLGLFAGQSLAQAAQVASIELSRPVSDSEILAWSEDETTRAASFLGPLAHSARPLIFHTSQAVAEMARRFGIAARHLPFALQRAITPLPKPQARAALGLGRQKLIISCGFLNAAKAVPLALQAFARLRQTHDAKLVFVGQAEADFTAHAAAHGLTPHVTLGTGYCTEATYRLWLSAADCALQLRAGPPGNISGALQDCINAGLPSVATADLADNLAAPAYVTRVSHNVAEIAAALAAQLSTPPATSAARAAYAAKHSMASYASSLAALLGLA
ncbi:glycosyltransferase [Acidocella sp.]|uniref:glycosyltransferase n=1 Tax=Acidocella sp. TaxID=50710 RepID=UPI002630A3E9|nr:glycosyltransferase [Acidocella sp.]